MLHQPLADKIRPRSLDEVVGQEHLLGPDGILRSLFERRLTQSMILYGPPGTGKSTIAYVAAEVYDLPMERFNASMEAKSKLQKIAESHAGHTFILLLDEIHRMDKGKQDWLLSYMETGSMMLIGTTTANPVISLSPAIRSRAHLFELRPIQPEDMLPMLERAWATIADAAPDPEAMRAIAQCSVGDCRMALNIVETLHGLHGTCLSVDDVEQFARNQRISFDKDESYHYDVISAMQCSMEGSDTDAALYYLAVLLESGDIETAIRRITCAAYEVVGLADPQVVARVVLACQAAREVGLPRASNFLAQAVIQLCLSPKSDSGRWSYEAARQDAQNHQRQPIPSIVRDTHYSGAHTIGHGGMLDPFAYPYGIAPQEYLPDSLVGRRYYQPRDNDHEQRLARTYEQIRRLQSRGEPGE
ncbi:MAG: replication-associated recombination protein A [Actinomyces urogenitalis]|uniref:replication-associated recombination protein A n=1 Tax=Actinomyces urogenitalis TaxID=103621 RepID=UPI002A816A74|nr:replication-associated recombination protein A [Actinomyces urogenitalis]MDY3678219.1 replication-associated recombination protein A [Actinomyces urogenitalis]